MVVLKMRLYKNPLRRRETRLAANNRMFEQMGNFLLIYTRCEFAVEPKRVTGGRIFIERLNFLCLLYFFQEKESKIIF